MSHEKYQKCIDLCNDCMVVCEHCATECLHEKDVKHMAHCIELDWACAEICRCTAALMSQGSEFAKQLCVICAEICQSCGNECSRHNMNHCQRCAEVCFACAQACREMADQQVMA